MTLFLLAKYVISAFLLALSILVYLQRRNSQDAARYARTVIICSAWTLLNAVNESLIRIGQASPWLASSNGVITLAAAWSFFDFAYRFPSRPAGRPVYAVAALCAAAAPFSFHPEWIHNRRIVDDALVSSFGWPYLVTSGTSIAAALAAVAALVQKLKQAHKSVRIQIQSILISSLLTICALTVFSVILPLLGFAAFYFVGVFSMWFLSYYALKAVARDGVFDFRRDYYRALRAAIAAAGIYIPAAIITSIIFSYFLLGVKLTVTASFVTAVVCTAVLRFFNISGLAGKSADPALVRKQIRDLEPGAAARVIERFFGIEPFCFAAEEGGVVVREGAPEGPSVLAGLFRGDETVVRTSGTAEQAGYCAAISIRNDGVRALLGLGLLDGVRIPTDLDLATLQFVLEEYFTTRRVRQLEMRLQAAQTETADSAFESTRNAAMRKLLTAAARYAKSDEPVLITGETGSGKEVLARFLHDHSSRHTEELHVLDCSNLPPTLVESELFGYEKGAFTGADRARPGIFERAGNGTLFLDELGELPLELQSRLLRVLNERTFRRIGGSTTMKTGARFIFATNRDLPAMIKKGTFREDLYYRINVLRLHLPPLRSRKEDIPLLASRFLQDSGQSDVQLSEAALQALCAHSWPGNIRELRHVIHRALVHARGGMIQPEDLALIAARDTESSVRIDGVPRSGLKGMLHDIEREILLKFMKDGKSQSELARVLKVERNYLRRRLKEHGLEVEK